MSKKAKKSIPNGIREKLYLDWSAFQRHMFIKNKTEKKRTSSLYTGTTVELEGIEYHLSQIYKYGENSSLDDEFSFTSMDYEMTGTFRVPGKVRKDGILNINLHALQQRIDELSVAEMMES